MYASLLGNLNIDTILLDVDAPGAGHIYLMFDSGVAVDEVDSQPFDRSEIVIHEDRVWIPVETTMYGHSFTAAWRNGADEYHLREEQGYIHEIDVSAALQVYRAGQPLVQDVQVPARETVDELVNIDLDAYDTRIQEFALAGAVSMDDPDGVYDAGAAYLRFNRLNDAVELLTRVLELQPDHADAINALGVVSVRQGSYDEGVEFFNRAAELMPNNAGVRLNIAISLYLMGRRAEAGEEYDRAVEMDNTLRDLLQFLNPDER